MTAFDIRGVRQAEIPSLPDIEADAAEAFRDIGLGVIADHPPMPAGEYATISDDGHIIVAVSANTDQLIGFAALGQIDGQAWLREMSVLRAYAGQGIGGALLNAAINWAGEHDFGFLALTTFETVPFNGPFYRRAGFAEFTPGPDWPALAAIRQSETNTGIEVSPRIAMVRAV